MCNDYGSSVSVADIERVLREVQIKLPRTNSNMAEREDIRPTDNGPVLRIVDDTLELSELKWGFPPPRSKAAAVINFRSEGRRFKHGRCLLPASHFFEFTGAKYPKTKWRFTKADEEWFCIAGLWRKPESGSEAYTMLTCEPGPDIKPYHDRQIVILERSNWDEWLYGDAPEHLLKHLPKGSLDVMKDREGS